MKLSQYRLDLDREVEKRRRLLKELIDIDKSLSDIAAEMKEFEGEHNISFSNTSEGPDDIGLVGLLDLYKAQKDRLLKDKNDSKDNRQKKREELKLLEDALAVQYSNAKEHFIPLFNSYAESFLGLNVDIQLSFTAKSASFKLNIEDSHRKEAHQLSESQRYFIDIALRMALLNYRMNNCTLMVDTPEGSLDIAYESRAGKMFADFAAPSSKMVMTANINTSKLLFELASICKNKRMQIVRMTEWAELSKVQLAQEAAIDGAFEELYEELNNE